MSLMEGRSEKIALLKFGKFSIVSIIARLLLISGTWVALLVFGANKFVEGNLSRPALYLLALVLIPTTLWRPGSELFAYFNGRIALYEIGHRIVFLNRFYGSHNINELKRISAGKFLGDHIVDMFFDRGKIRIATSDLEGSSDDVERVLTSRYSK